MKPVTVPPDLEAYLRLLNEQPILSINSDEAAALAEMDIRYHKLNTAMDPYFPSRREGNRRELEARLSQAVEQPEDLEKMRSELAKFDASATETCQAARRACARISMRAAELLEPALRREREKLVPYIAALRAIDLSPYHLSSSALLSRAEGNLAEIDREIETVFNVARGWHKGGVPSPDRIGRLIRKACDVASSEEQTVEKVSAPTSGHVEAATTAIGVVDDPSADPLAGLPPPAATEARA